MTLPAVFPYRLLALFVLCAAPWVSAQESLAVDGGASAAKDNASTPEETSGEKPELPYFDPSAPSPEYRTPRSGEGFETNIFGEHVRVEPRNRRSVAAWDVGLSAVSEGVSEAEVLPFASLYFWENPDDNFFFRGIVVGLFNDIIVAKSTDSMGPFEAILTFQNLTIPVAQAEWIDGERLDQEELVWGRVHLGLGYGYRKQLENPGHNDNMFEASLLAEPGYLYFNDDSDTADNFVEPQDTFEIRGRFRLRCDALERNLLELPHRGFAFGGDVVGGYRTNWEDWGIDRREDSSDGESYIAASGYCLVAGGVPFVNSDRHRLIGSFHGGTGDNLDRFSRFRIGGGPDPFGEEYDATSRAVLPGAFIEEFTTDYYASFVGEYQWEPIFFTYLGVRGQITYLDRLRSRSGGIDRQDDVLASVGGRITTGFFWETRLQLDYNYNFDVIRDREFGGHEITFHISREF